MTFIQYLEQIDWIGFLGQIFLLIGFFMMLSRCNKLQNYCVHLKKGLDHIQADNLIGYYSNEYKIYNKGQHTKEGEIRYVYPKLSSIAQEITFDEMKKYFCKFYGLTIQDIENIISNF